MHERCRGEKYEVEFFACFSDCHELFIHPVLILAYVLCALSSCAHKLKYYLNFS